MNNRGSSSRLSIGTLLGICAVTTVSEAGHAQEVTAEAGKLQEIVVTAQKRREDLQEVPISAQVVTAQLLAEQNHNSLADLTQMTPGVHVSQGEATNSLFIRGIGSGPNPAFDQSVATFVDDIYRGRSRASNATFLDLERIEVLKGPQSTYFGNNAIAGALNLVTAKPGREFDAWARLLYGTFGQYAAEGAVNIPVADTFSMRLAVTRNGDDKGWIYNGETGRSAPIVNNEAGRLTLAYRPTEDFDATLKFEGSKQKLSGSFTEYPAQWTNCPPPAPFSPQFAAIPGAGCPAALAINEPIGLDHNSVNHLGGTGNSLSTFENVLTVNYTKWDHTFTSVSGFNNYHFNIRSESGLLPTFLQTVEQPEKYHQFSQEFRVASPTGGAIEYLAGIYYQHDSLSYDSIFVVPFVNFLAPVFDIPEIYLPLSAVVHFSQTEDIYSAFGSLTWNATDRLKLKLGLRASSVEKDFDGSLHYGTSTQLYGGFQSIPPDIEGRWQPGLGSPGEATESKKEHAWMPSVGIQFQLSPDAMTYLTYSRGFKAGGYNGLTPFVAGTDNIGFGPETADAYEVGIKSTWFDNRLRVNLDGFLTQYQGLQLQTVVPDPSLPGVYLGITANAASARSEGAELELEWAPTQAFHLAANVMYLDAYFVSFPNSPAGSLQQFCTGLSAADFSATPQCAVFPYPVPGFANASGQRLQYSPRWSGNMIASYSLPLRGGYKFKTEVSPFFTSDYYSGGNGNDPFFRVPGYLRLDGRLSLESPDGRWAVDFIGKNLTDRVIVEAHQGFNAASKELPRTFAGQVRVKW